MGSIVGAIRGRIDNDYHTISGLETIVEPGGTVNAYATLTRYSDYVLPNFTDQLTLAGSARFDYGNAGHNNPVASDFGWTLEDRAGDDALRGGSGDEGVFEIARRAGRRARAAHRPALPCPAYPQVHLG